MPHTHEELRREFFKEFPLCDCRNNMPPHFADGRGINAQWVADWWLQKFAEREQALNVNIGMLRQWLNEDRITDHTRMITNEDIKHWLNQ